jgi:hypothetical protein
MDLSRAKWRKSDHSGTETNCVEVAAATNMIVVRDSKNLDGPVLAFTPAAWADFLTRAKNSHHRHG